MALANKIYYQQGNAVGAEGDFITAPQLSSLFGEIIGLSLLDAWIRLGSPTSFDLIECGPGRGLLMEDILRITDGFKDFQQALSLKFIEINPLFCFEKHHKTFPDLKEALTQRPTFIVANEFFDALPIHQYLPQESTLIERRILYRSSHLIFSYEESPEIVEICPWGQKIFETIIDHLKHWGGAALIIDYGDASSPKGSTLQAVYRHKKTSPLQRPGRQDLTAHVNFEPFIRYAERGGPTLKWHFETQRSFLLSRGAYARAQQALKTMHQAEKRDRYQGALQRLVDPDAMGSLFKVLWVEHPQPAPFLKR